MSVDDAIRCFKQYEASETGDEMNISSNPRIRAIDAVADILGEQGFQFSNGENFISGVQRMVDAVAYAFAVPGYSPKAQGPGKRCIVLGSINGEGFRHCILLQTPNSGGLSILTDDTQVMVYGQIEEQNYKPARWHHFPARNVIRYEVEAV